MQELADVARGQLFHVAGRQAAACRSPDAVMPEGSTDYGPPATTRNEFRSTKGGILTDSYRWVLSKRRLPTMARTTNRAHLLWIRGDPGKGKTMLLCGIIDELSNLRWAQISRGEHVSLVFLLPGHRLAYQQRMRCAAGFDLYVGRAAAGTPATRTRRCTIRLGERLFRGR